VVKISRHHGNFPAMVMVENFTMIVEHLTTMTGNLNTMAGGFYHDGGKILPRRWEILSHERHHAGIRFPRKQ
jgi:hypothetical protein